MNEIERGASVVNEYTVVVERLVVVSRLVGVCELGLIALSPETSRITDRRSVNVTKVSVLASISAAGNSLIQLWRTRGD